MIYYLKYVRFLVVKMFGYLKIMRAIIQRVLTAEVTIQGHSSQSISRGLVVLLGIGHDDTSDDVIVLANKILNLRVFSQRNKMNLSIQDITGDLLLISQFTLYADCTKGNRPSFINAAKPVHAKKIYAEFVNYMHNQNLIVKTGVFGAHMEVSLTNDGPVTLIIDTKQ